MRCRRVSYAQERHLFHVLVTKGFTFLCMADEVTSSMWPTHQRLAFHLVHSSPQAPSHDRNAVFDSSKHERKPVTHFLLGHRC